MVRDYRGTIWTDHALTKLKEREIKQSDAWAVFSHPDGSKYSIKKGAWVYFRVVGDKKISVVAKKNKDGKWVIISVWSGWVKEDRKSTYEFIKKYFQKLLAGR